MKDKEKQNCYNCTCKSVCMKIADIDEQGLISWNEYIKQYGCEHYQPKLPEDSVVLSRATWFETQNYKYNLGFNTGKWISRKETAEKILNELYCTPREQVENKIKDLARFIGVEIKE